MTIVITTAPIPRDLDSDEEGALTITLEDIMGSEIEGDGPDVSLTVPGIGSLSADGWGGLALIVVLALIWAAVVLMRRCLM